MLAMLHDGFPFISLIKPKLSVKKWHSQKKPLSTEYCFKNLLCQVQSLGLNSSLSLLFIIIFCKYVVLSHLCLLRLLFKHKNYQPQLCRITIHRLLEFCPRAVITICNMNWWYCCKLRALCHPFIRMWTLLLWWCVMLHTFDILMMVN